MSATRDDKSSATAHELFLYRAEGLDHYACTCGARVKVPSTQEQASRATTLSCFAAAHLSATRFEGPVQ